MYKRDSTETEKESGGIIMGIGSPELDIMFYIKLQASDS